MTLVEEKMATVDMTAEELIEFLNDELDIYSFPLSEIKEVDDDEQWDKIAEKIGGYRMYKALERSIIPGLARWFQYDSEADNGRFEFFCDKDDILNYFGIDNIIQELEERYGDDWRKTEQ